MKSKWKLLSVERLVYMFLIVLLVLYGLWDSEVAIRLMAAVKDAFSILFTLQ